MNISELKKRAGIVINESYGLTYFGVDNIDDVPETQEFRDLMDNLHVNMDYVRGVALDDDMLLVITIDSIEVIDLHSRIIDRTLALGDVL